MRDLITHFFNAHDVEVAKQYLATDLKWHGGLVGDVDGVRTYADRMPFEDLGGSRETR